MGQNQSQTIDTFIQNYVNTSVISEVISRYATRTESINRNVQDINLVIDVQDISGDVLVFQRIDSVIDVISMIDRADNTELTSELQNAVANEMKSGIERVSSVFSGLFNTPTDQLIKNKAISEISSSVRNAITTDTVDDLIISSNNIQGQTVNITARDITGDLTFDQRIQSDIIARNIVESVTESVIKNEAINNLSNIITSSTKSESSIVNILGIVTPIVIGIILVILTIVFVPKYKGVIALIILAISTSIAIFFFRRGYISG